MNTVQTEADLTNARRHLGPDAPADVVAAKARCYAWRMFAAHAPEELKAHRADVELVDAFEASRRGDE